MRSMSISGSSWNSLIFTVSDKILLRFLRSSSTWKDRHTRVKYEATLQSIIQQFVCLPLIIFYLWGQLSVLHLSVLLCVGQDGSERAAQVFLLEVWWLSHQWGQRHGDLHLHSWEVLKETDETAVNISVKQFCSVYHTIKQSAHLWWETAA